VTEDARRSRSSVASTSRSFADNAGVGRASRAPGQRLVGEALHDLRVAVATRQDHPQLGLQPAKLAEGLLASICGIVRSSSTRRSRHGVGGRCRSPGGRRWRPAPESRSARASCCHDADGSSSSTSRTVPVPRQAGARLGFRLRALAPGGEEDAERGALAALARDLHRARCLRTMPRPQPGRGHARRISW